MGSVPFLQLFAAWRPAGALRRVVEPMQVVGSSLRKSERSMTVRLRGPRALTEGELNTIQRELRAAYGLNQVELQVEVQAPAAVEAAKPASAPVPAPAEKREPTAAGNDAFQRTEERRRKALEAIGPVAVSHPSQGKKNGEGTVLFGRPAKKHPKVFIDEIQEDSGLITIEGDVFCTEHIELKKRQAWMLRFDISDQHGAIRVAKYVQDGDNQAGKRLAEAITEGMHLIVQGRLSPYMGEDQMEPVAIVVGKKTVRQDLAKGRKRIELHLHTQMSQMDATTDLTQVIKRAAAWGHPAIAVTDHGVCHDFPTAYSVAKKAGIKMLFGVEAYFFNDLDENPIVRGNQDQDFHGEYVCFDLETTGLDSRRDTIIEIGAVVLRDGVVTDETFSVFVNPGRPLSHVITQLTGITDDMVKDGLGEREALEQFLAFVKGRPLAAHNAVFDVGFVSEGCRRHGIPFEATALDTLPLCQALLPQLSKFKLDVVAGYLSLPAFQHHRATDDAATVGYMLPPLFKKLEEQEDVHTLSALNAWSAGKIQVRKHRRIRHLIILAKNQTGLRNLYKLVSLAHLEHFERKMYPVMPKSLINANREGLIMGSACEAGELFQAVVRKNSWAELKRIASWYDYLEIQPLSNNGYMLRPQKRTGKPIASSEEELRDFNRTVVALGREMGKPVCATGDVHFLEPEDEIFRHILLNTKGFEDADAPNPLYFRTTDEMLQEFSYLGEEEARRVVIDDPHEVASWCGDLNPLPKGLFVPKLENSEEELSKLVWDKVHALYGDNPPQLIVDRLNVELSGILGKYDVVYMSAQKLVQRSLENGYLVGSRGSVGSSLVAYMSGITEVNALPPHYRCPNCRHNEFITDGSYGCGADMPDKVCPVCGTKYVKDGFDIPFETFLGFGGGKVPDIDLNFSGEYQATAHKHTFELFGEGHVFRAGTIGTVAEKTAYGHVLKYMEEHGRTANRPELVRLSRGCTGVKRTTGQHPGGMVVIPGDMEIYDFCPVQHPADDVDTDIVTTHFEYHSMEDNLLKLDMLGHDDPSMVRMLEDLTGVNAREIPLDDPDTMSIFISSKVLGFENDPILGPTGAVAIPEFNTKFTRQMLMDTQPKDFNTLVRLSGFSHGTDVWLGNARELILNGTASVLETVGCRDDIMLYLIKQGLDPKMSFKIMEAVRKGKVKKNGFEEGWEEAMRSHNVPDWYIKSLATIGYLFPKAHAVAYVMMAFRIAWFKVHRPLAFYATYFSVRAKAFDATVMCQGMETVRAKMVEIEGKEKPTPVEETMLTTLEVVYEYYLRGFTFHPLDLYRSAATQFVMDEEENALIPPFMAIPGLGETAAESIVEQRKGKKYISIQEFSADCPKVTKAHIELLRDCGALGDLPETSQITLF